MNAVNVFLDTNILVYAHDVDAGERHLTARHLVAEFWNRRQVPVLSIQVLQEFHVNLTRKGLEVDRSAEVVRRYLAWRVVNNSESLLRLALESQQRWQVSFWDASIIAAAQQAGARELWSQDLNSGQDYGGVLVVNPLN